MWVTERSLSEKELESKPEDERKKIKRHLNKNNFWNLSIAFEKYQPKNFVVLGDMVHSTENKEWVDFSDFLDNYPGMERLLIRGNHELYDNSRYEKMGFDVLQNMIQGPFIFTHEPMELISDQRMNLCGHIHPAIRLVGSASQSVRLPCFWIKENQMVLPAFGEFTGMHSISPRRGDRIVAVAENKVVEIAPDAQTKK
jgi:DNA ligase-associated metallophosphoesterase